MRCPVCGELMMTSQIAHRIPQTKANLRRYGEAVIHHEYNLERVCGLGCNDAVSISNHPLAKSALLVRIWDNLAAREREKVGEP